MDSERRQAHRRQSIIVELEEGVLFEAKPLPWLKRNDFGNEVVKQHTASINEAVRLYTDPETNVPILEAKLYERITDPIGLITDFAYPGTKAKDLNNLTWRQLIELLLAALEVNDLQHLARMIDPNSQAPTENGTSQPSEGALEEALGQKIESIVDSSLPESADQISSP